MIDFNDFEVIEGLPFKGINKKLLVNFLAKNDIEYDEKIEYSIILRENLTKIIATVSLDNNVIKCIAVDSKYRNEGILAKLLTLIIKKAIEKGLNKLFIFTKKENKQLFTSLGFYLIAETDKIILLENERNGIDKYINKIKKETDDFILQNNIIATKVGIIIANCNPFTLGHRYLIETSASKCDLLHVFILSGDRKYFSQKERLYLVKEGCKDLKNVIIHKAGDYLISPATFPTYFIKDKTQTSKINCSLDIEIFLKKIVPSLNINIRFLGEEPLDIVTNSYNEQLKQELNKENIQLSIIKRKENQKEIISATKVRKAIEEKDIQRIADLVPDVTYIFIKDKFNFL